MKCFRENGPYIFPNNCDTQRSQLLMFNPKLIIMKIYYLACFIVLGLTFNSCTTDEIETTNGKQTQYENLDSADFSNNATTTTLDDGEPVPPKGKDN